VNLQLLAIQLASMTRVHCVAVYPHCTRWQLKCSLTLQTYAITIQLQDINSSIQAVLQYNPVQVLLKTQEAVRSASMYVIIIKW